MKRILFLAAACLILCPMAWGDDAKPAPPALPGDDLMPPPLDLSSLTPSPSPKDKVNQKTQPEKMPVEAAPQPTDTPAPVPAKPAVAEPTEAPTPEAAEPTATAAKEEASTTGATVSAGALTDYFPAAEGTQWSYEYLKPAEGQAAKGTFTVKCVSAKTMANGTVRVTLETTNNGQPTRDQYSLFNNQVVHTATGDQALTGDFAFKLPPASGSASWMVTEKDGTVHKSKAALGQAQVYQKTYPDCVIVTEKILKDGKPERTIIYYYAKGTGLVSMEVYSKGMKLLQDKSFALAADAASK
jgi:hypothetical protein